MKYVIVTKTGRVVHYEGVLALFTTQSEAASLALAGDSIVPFDPALHQVDPGQLVEFRERFARRQG